MRVFSVTAAGSPARGTLLSPARVTNSKTLGVHNLLPEGGFGSASTDTRD